MKKLFIFIYVVLFYQNAFSQTIMTIAGTNIAGYSGDGGPATSARLHSPGHVAFDNSGNITFADYVNNAVRKINGRRLN